MNKENIQRVIDQIKREDSRFSMANFVRYWPVYLVPDDLRHGPEGDSLCVTPSCIGGHAVHLYNQDHGTAHGLSKTHIAARFFGMESDNQTDKLFAINNSRESRVVRAYCSREAAVYCLEGLMETGQVSWKRVFKKAGIEKWLT